MLDKKERIIITLAISISAITLVAVVIWRAAFFTPALQSQTPKPQFQTEHYHHEYPPSKPLAENKKELAKTAEESAKTNIEPNTSYKLSLNNVIKAAKTWKPAYTSWFGQKAPDFTLTDINGKQHKLSNYRGKNVMIIFWATWCGPCLMEIPHLTSLRNIIGEDKLAMLAISYITVMPPNTTEMVKRFVEQKKINYTVLSVDVANVPAPYNKIRGIPCSFFIDSEGKIKLATEGLLSFGEIEAILQAE